VRKFHIGRIKSAQILQNDFQISSSFDADEYLSRGFGVVSDGVKHTVKLSFSPIAAVYVTEKEWHKNQVITSTEDGGAVLQFTTEGLDAVKRWVLSFGGEVRVIGPQELREDVRKEAERILAEG
jgi:predicted DNA-binding transcriptional regulator YafY